MFSIRIHHGGRFHKHLGRRYVNGKFDIFDMVDIEVFSMIELYVMVLQLGYKGESKPLFYNNIRLMSSLNEGLFALACDEDISCLDNLVRSFKLVRVFIKHGYTIGLSYLRAHHKDTHGKDFVCDYVTPTSIPHGLLTHPTDEFVITYTHLSGAQALDTQYHVRLTIKSQFIAINLRFISVQPTANQVLDDMIRHISFDDMELDGEVGFVDVTEEVLVSELPNDHMVNESDTYVDLELAGDVGRTKEHVVEHVRIDEVVHGSGEEVVEQGNGEEFVKHDDDLLVDEENEIVEPDVDVHLFGITKDVPFDNIRITSLLPEDVLDEDNVDVVNVDRFDSETSYKDQTGYGRRKRLNELRKYIEGRVLNDIAQWKYSFYYRRKFGSPKEVKDKVYFGPIGPRKLVGVGPSESSGPCTRSKKRKNVGTNDDSQASSFVVEAHDKGDLYPWVWDNPDFLVKAVQDQLQRNLKFQVSISKASRAKAKAERESTNLNTTVKITVEWNTYPYLPTRVFKRIYVCLRSLNKRFRACIRKLLGLYGAFMKGPFLGQVLTTVGLDSNNGIYPLAYALVEVESKIS
ncbi:hypothetical protein Tco_0154931 [Tanacetum coccineum]